LEETTAIELYEQALTIAFKSLKSQNSASSDLSQVIQWHVDFADSLLEFGIKVCNMSYIDKAANYLEQALQLCQNDDEKSR